MSDLMCVVGPTVLGNVSRFPTAEAETLLSGTVYLTDCERVRHPAVTLIDDNPKSTSSVRGSEMFVALLHAL